MQQATLALDTAVYLSQRLPQATCRTTSSAVWAAACTLLWTAVQLGGWQSASWQAGIASCMDWLPGGGFHEIGPTLLVHLMSLSILLGDRMPEQWLTTAHLS